jgi:hypothetical protein
MNLKQTATIVTTGGALAAWLVGGTATNHPVAPAPIVQRSPVDTKSEELATEIGRLRDRLRPTTTPRQPGRNLFRFHAAPVAPRPVVAAPAPPPVDMPPPAPTIMPMRLIGIAEDPGADPATDSPVRIAFISAGGQLFNVKEGESILDLYRVTKIAADVVELTDASDGTVRRLALR